LASIDAHIKFAGVNGESAHIDHKGEIEVLSWTWGVVNGGGGIGGGSGKGKAAVPRRVEWSLTGTAESAVRADARAVWPGQGWPFAATRRAWP
jgi:type VI protein secretion system component Hcp